LRHALRPIAPRTRNSNSLAIYSTPYPVLEGRGGSDTTSFPKHVGDLRYDTPQHLRPLNQLYDFLHCYLNFFIPVMKLKEKVRTGSNANRA